MQFYEAHAKHARRVAGESLTRWEKGEITAEIFVMECALFALHSKIKFPDTPRRSLSHYTNMNAFLSIISSSSLRYYDVKYMNDTSEKIHAISFIEDKVKKYLDKNKFGEKVSNIPDILITALKNGQSTRNTLAFCLSGAQDNVSQWNAYSSENGVELVFSAKELVKFQSCPGLRNASADIIYDDLEKTRIIDLVMKQIIWCLIHVIYRTDRDRGKVSQAVAGSVWSLQYLLLRFKDSAFSNERETRFITEVFSNDSRIKSECRGGYIRSYIEVRKLRADGQPKKLPLTQVRIAPGRNADDRKKSIEDALLRFGYARPKVSVSGVPLRHFG